MPDKGIVYTTISKFLRAKGFLSYPMPLGYKRPEPAHLSKSTTILSYLVLTQYRLSTLS